MQHYKIIEIFTGAEARWQGQPLHSAVVQAVHDLKIAARCLVLRGIEGAYESGEIATGSLEVLSYNMPLRITIVAPAAEAEKIVALAKEMVQDGIVAMQEVQVVSHRTRGALTPKHTRVRDVMTPEPQKVSLATPLPEVARLLLSTSFSGLPVVDAQNRPVGFISQGDLIYKAGMPMRLGLLAESDQDRLSAVLEALAGQQLKEVMAQPAVVIDQDQYLTGAVQLMLAKDVKRLPVTDDAGKLVGILSRLDVFDLIGRETPDWCAFQEQKIAVENLRFVADVMRRDTVTVLPEAPVEEVLRLIDCNEIQWVAVVDQEGHFQGLISDGDLLAAFVEPQPGIWDYFISKLPFTELGRSHRDLEQRLQSTTAGEIMKPDIITVREEAPLNEAIRLMRDRALKRLPVLDAQGKFRGLVSREALLRAGFAS